MHISNTLCGSLKLVHVADGHVPWGHCCVCMSFCARCVFECMHSYDSWRKKTVTCTGMWCMQLSTFAHAHKHRYIYINKSTCMHSCTHIWYICAHHTHIGTHVSVCVFYVCVVCMCMSVNLCMCTAYERNGVCEWSYASFTCWSKIEGSLPKTRHFLIRHQYFLFWSWNVVVIVFFFSSDIVLFIFTLFFRYEPWFSLLSPPKESIS